MYYSLNIVVFPLSSHCNLEQMSRTLFIAGLHQHCGKAISMGE